MAVVAQFSGLQIRRWLQHCRYVGSEVSAKHLKQSSGSNGGPLEATEPVIPMVPKKRDPDAVLKALGSTVEPVEWEMMDGMGAADPLYPLSKSVKMDYLNHREAGRKAAKYVLNRWPKMFTTKKLDLDPGVRTQTKLDYYIEKHKAGKCMRAYNKMKANGEFVSMDTKNDLLALVAFFGLRSPYIPRSKMTEVYAKHTDISWWTGGQKLGPHAREKVEELEKAQEEETEDEESVGENLKMTRIEGGVRIWSSANVAEKLFKEDFSEEKNGGTYDAIIQGLLKYKNLQRAFELFDAMRSEGYQARTCTYNLLLLSLIECRKKENIWRKATYLLGHMTSEPKVSPNTETFDVLLQVAAWDASATNLCSRIMREMHHVGVEPSLTTLWILLNNFNSHDRGKSLITEMVTILEKNPGIIHLQSAHCYKFFSLAIKACMGLGSSETGVRLYRLVEKHANSGLVDNMNFFVSNYLLVLCREDSPLEFIMTEYKRLVPRELIPYEWVYAELFIVCTRYKNLGFMESLMADIRKLDVKITNWRTLSSLSNVISKTKVPDEDADKYMAILDEVIQWLMGHGELPTKTPINTLIKLAAQSRDFVKMWKYYDLFDMIKEDPTFEALSTLLRSYYNSTDKDKILWIMKKMISYEMTLPRNLIREMCAKSDIDPETSKLMESQLSHHSQRVVGSDRGGG